jgi:hypothetical protein
MGPRLNAIGHGSDGSIVFSLITAYDETYHGDLGVGTVNNWISTFWVNASSPGPSNIWHRVALSDRSSLIQIGDQVVSGYDYGLHPKAHYTSSRRILFQQPRIFLNANPDVPAIENLSVDQHGQLIESVRNITNGSLTSDKNFLDWNNRTFIQRSTLTVEGKANWLYELSGSQIIVWRNSNGIPLEAFRVDIPPGAVIPLDTASIVKVNHDDGSAVIQSDSADLFWIAGNSSATAGHLLRLNNTINGRPMFVSGREVVVWANAYDTVNNAGGMAFPDLRYYSQEEGRFRTIGLDYRQLGSLISGRFIMETPPFTPAPGFWAFTTVNADNPTSISLYSYLLTTALRLDSDSDGLPDVLELRPKADPTLGPTDPRIRDTDGDGLSDGDELYPFYVINGSFTWAEAETDAIARGGRLAVIPTRDDYEAVKARFGKRSLFSLWIGATDRVAEGTWMWVTKNDQPIRPFNQTEWVEPGPIDWSDFYTTSPLIPWADNRPDNTNNADGLILRTDLKFEDRPILERRGYLIEYTRTDATKADSDDDGIKDSDEIFVHRTDPSNPDTDRDGINDFLELTGYRYDVATEQMVQDSNGFRTNPLLPDTDGDNVSDFLEVAGYRWDAVEETYVLDPINGFRTNPNLRDTDRDGIPDDVQARGGNNPNKPIVVHDRPQIVGDPQTITIDQSFTAFGARPATDKTSEDGSVAMRDQNGMMIWIDNQNRPILVPNSTLAKTLYVSNTELLVWQNRFASGYDQVGSNSEVVLHRRNEEGAVESTEPIVIQGTLLETASVSAGPFGFTLVGSERIPTDPVEESLRTSGEGATVTVPVDQWDRQIFTQYRVTLDGQSQQLDQLALLVPKVGGNLTTANVTATSTDGALFVNLETAGNTRVVEALDESFFTVETGVWFTWQQNAEKIEFFSFAEKPSPLYVANDRLVIEDKDTGSIVDYRKQGTADVSVVGEYPLPGGGTVLALNPFNRAGIDPLFYVATTNGIQLHSLDVGLFPIGNVVQVPGQIQANTQFVRNPADGSLLIRGEGSTGVIWIPSEVDSITGEIRGLSSAIVLPATAQGAPMFVDGNQAVVWMNETAPLGVGGVVPPAQIAHFSFGTDFKLKRTDLVPPIEGRFVAQTPRLTTDPFDDGWFITTFANTSSRSTVSRTYRLRTVFDIDADGDGLPDLLENRNGTGLATRDSDGDGLSDGDELYPYYVVSGSFTWLEAAADAKAKGGRLAIPNNRDDYEALRKRFGSGISASLWLGASDAAIEGEWKWDNGTLLNQSQWDMPGNLDWSDFYTSGSAVPWAPGKPDNFNNADGLTLRRDFSFEDRPILERRGYLIEYPRSNPINLDTDGDGRNDFDERQLASDPNVKDSFAGVPILPNPAGVVPFSNIGNTYYHLVYDPVQGHIGIKTVKLSTKGTFSYEFKGLNNKVKASGRGAFSGNGAYSGPGPKGLSDVASLDMQMVQESGIWKMLSVMTRRNGEQLGSEGLQPKYSKSNPYPLAGSFTMAFPLAGPVVTSVTEPSGEGVATGSIDRAANVKTNYILPNGERSTSSGPILVDDYHVVHALSSKGSKCALVGAIDMVSTRPSLDYGGTLRLYADAGTVNGQATTAIDQLRLVEGSVYTPPAKGLAPLPGLSLAGWNISFNMLGGAFDGVSKVAAWGANNKITTPSSPTTVSKAAYNSKIGLMTFSLTETDPILRTSTKANGHAVVLQRPEQIRGYYNTPFSSGRLSVTEHDGSAPPLTMIAPVAKTVIVGASVYNVQVSTPGAWQVVLPENSWVSAEIVQGGTGELNGSGNGIVQITVQANPTRPPIWRYLTIEIAGIKHNITQDYMQRR